MGKIAKVENLEENISQTYSDINIIISFKQNGKPLQTDNGGAKHDERGLEETSEEESEAWV